MRRETFRDQTVVLLGDQKLMSPENVLEWAQNNPEGRIKVWLGGYGHVTVDRESFLVHVPISQGRYVAEVGFRGNLFVKEYIL